MPSSLAKPPGDPFPGRPLVLESDSNGISIRSVGPIDTEEPADDSKSGDDPRELEIRIVAPAERGIPIKSMNDDGDERPDERQM